MKDLRLSEVLNLIDELNSNNSSNNKIDVLKRYNSNEFIKNILYYTYNTTYQYFVTTDILNKHFGKSIANAVEYQDIFKLLDDLRSRRISGYVAIQSVNNFCLNNIEFKDVIYKIINKDLEIRMGISLINKSIPNLIPTFDVALAVDFDKVNIDFVNDQWFSSRKLDGVRCITIVDENGNSSCWSRQGKQFTVLEKVEQAINDLQLKNIVFDGEICLVDDMGREDFQGIMKQIRKKDHQIENPKYLIFDYLPIEDFYRKKGDVKFLDRYILLKDLINAKSEVLNVVDQTLIVDENHYIDLMQYSDANNWEGLILRKNVVYEGKRTKNMVKCKLFQDNEYVVEKLEFGPFRIIENDVEVSKDVLTNIIIRHKGYAVSVGSGFSLPDRIYYKDHPEELIGKTVTVKYFQETKNQNGGISLRFPTVKAIFNSKRDV